MPKGGSGGLCPCTRTGSRVCKPYNVGTQRTRRNSENKDAHNPQNAYSVRLSETKIWSTFLSVLSELKRSAQRTVRPIENYFRPLSVYLLSMK